MFRFLGEAKAGSGDGVEKIAIGVIRNFMVQCEPLRTECEFVGVEKVGSAGIHSTESCVWQDNKNEEG